MTNWKTFKVTKKDFASKEAYTSYMNLVKCAVCHKVLKFGDEYDLRPIQTPAETGSLTVQAVIVHRKCLG